MKSQVLDDTLFLLGLMGLNPTIKTSLKLKLFNYICISIIYTCPILMTMEILLNFNGMTTILRAMESIPIVLVAGLKTSLLIRKKTQIAEIMKVIEKFWSLNKFQANKHQQKYIVQPLKIARTFFVIFVIFGVITGGLFAALPILLKLKILPIIFYNENHLTPPYFEFVYILQLCFIYLLVFSVFGNDGLFISFNAHAIAELRAVRLILFEGNASDDKLIEVVHHHDYVLRFIKMVNDLYSTFFLNHYVTTIFADCFYLLLITANEIPDLVHVINYVFFIIGCNAEFFVYCFAGSELIKESLKVAGAAFYGKWVNPRLKMNKNYILMIIQRSQRCAGITIGGFINLDLTSFALQLRHAFSFYTFLRALYNR